MHGEGSTTEESGFSWKSIWTLQVPNNVRVFPWKMCKNILPTKDNLHEKGVVQDATCMFCEQEVETIIHVIWQCSVAQDVWGACNRYVQKSQSFGTAVTNFLEFLQQQCTKEEFDLCARIACMGHLVLTQLSHTWGDFIHPVQIVK
jgi:hypothetical protein